MNKKLLAWHFVPENKKLRYSGEPLIVGKTVRRHAIKQWLLYFAILATILITGYIDGKMQL